jgi:carboxyl-terminal processing protease
MPRRTLWLMFAAVVICFACYERADHNPYGHLFAEVMETIDRYYVERVDEQKLFEGALQGMMGRLDDHSAFLPRNEAPQFEESLDQEYGGVGIEVSLEGDNKQLTVMTPLVGTPAFKAGILAGDRIVAINGRGTANLPLQEVVPMLRGRPGDEVNLTIDRAGADRPIQFRVVRARIQTDSVLGDSRNSDGSWDFLLAGDDERIGYVRINTFGKSTVTEFEAALKWLADRNCRGVIIDLRNNPGGLLDAGKLICDLFMPAGQLIVSMRGRDAQERGRFDSTGRGPYQDLPLVVLVNDKSASASEIVAACFQDHGRATIVGERTWGKGTVQNVIPLEGGKSLLKLTIASYWRPSGKNIHRMTSSKDSDDWGVKPDPGCEVKLDEKDAVDVELKSRKFDLMPKSAAGSTSPAAGGRLAIDPQLKRAAEAMREKLSSRPAGQSRA